MPAPGARFGNRSLAWLDATTLVAAERAEATRPRIVIWDVAQAMSIHRISIGLLAGLDRRPLVVGTRNTGKLSEQGYRQLPRLQPRRAPLSGHRDAVVSGHQRGQGHSRPAHGGALQRPVSPSGMPHPARPALQSDCVAGQSA